MVELYLNSPIYLHSIVLNYIIKYRINLTLIIIIIIITIYGRSNP
jgi:hypothetical protein